MGNLVRLRVALADRPGALARVAGIIGDYGGNIASIDVQRAGVVNAVDDLVLDLPEDCDLGRIRADLVASGLATVVSYQTAQTIDPVVAALDQARVMLAAPSADRMAVLVRGVEALCNSPVVWVSPKDEAVLHDAGRFAFERGGAIALRTTKLPPALADRLPGEVWLLAVPDPSLAADGLMVFVARALTNEFTSTEITRIEALMAFQEQLDRSVVTP